MKKNIPITQDSDDNIVPWSKWGSEDYPYKRVQAELQAKDRGIYHPDHE
jgi:hypothetical protein